MMRIFLLLLVSVSTCELSAQTTPLFSRDSSNAPQTATRSVTPAELAFGVKLYQDRVTESVPPSSVRYPKDSILHAIITRATNGVERLPAPVRGIHLDPAGRLLAAALDDASAKQRFAERLATPGLSMQDRAYTLFTAVQAFADSDYPQRFAVAEQYLAQLDTLPSSQAIWKYQAESRMTAAYYQRGDAEQVVTHGRRALDNILYIPFADRGIIFENLDTYVMVVDALSGLPHAPARIKAVNTAFLPLTIPSPELVALDSAYAEIGAYWTRFRVKPIVVMSEQLGTPVPPIVAHYWFNMTPPSVAVQPVTGQLAAHVSDKRLDDGVIRLVELGEYNCRPCLQALPALERLRTKFPDGVEPLYVTETSGAWGGRFVTPAEEVQLLKAYYLDQRKYTFPIALWAGEKEPTPDGGMVPISSPSFDTLHVTATPTFVLVDGHGIIRHVSRGFDRDEEGRLINLIQYLVAEARASRSASL